MYHKTHQLKIYSARRLKQTSIYSYIYFSYIYLLHSHVLLSMYYSIETRFIICQILLRECFSQNILMLLFAPRAVKSRLSNVFRILELILYRSLRICVLRQTRHITENNARASPIHESATLLHYGCIISSQKKNDSRK